MTIELTTSAHASKNSGILLLGQPKVGKTVCASTISKHLDDGDLKDLLYVSFDPGGSQSLASFQRQAPIFDVSGLTFREFSKEWKDGLANAILSRVKSGETRVVIFDTISTFDTWLLDDLNDDWGAIRDQHFKIANFCRSVVTQGGNYIVTAHLKSNLGDWVQDEKTVAAKAAAQSVVTSLVMNITGKGKERWRAQVAHTLPITREGGKRFIHPWGKGKEIEGFTRGPPNLPDKMEANLTKFLALCGE